MNQQKRNIELILLAEKFDLAALLCYSVFVAFDIKKIIVLMHLMKNDPQNNIIKVKTENL